MKKCPFCSAEILDDAEFCIYCMTSLTEKTVIRTPKILKKQLILRLISVSLILCLLVAAFLSKSPLNNDANLFLSSTNSSTSQNPSNETPAFSDNSLFSHVSSDNTSIPPFENNESGNEIGPNNTSTELENNVSSQLQSNISSVSSKNQTPSSIVASSFESVSSITSYVSDPSLFKFNIISTSYYLLGFSSGKFAADIIIPESYNGLPIAKIDNNAFANLSGIKSVYIPPNVKRIGKNAFYGCSDLYRLVLSEGLYQIDEEAFYNTSIENLVIPSTVVIIENLAFSNCKLKSVVIKCSDARISGNTFATNTSLESVTLPQGMTSICGGMFSRCSGLKTIDLPQSITTIGNYAFRGCSSFETIDLKNTETLQHNVFNGCTRLKSIYISEKLKYISYNVFSECSSLTDIYYSGTKAQWEKISKHAKWNLNEGTSDVFASYTIHCKDGDIKA